MMIHAKSHSKKTWKMQRVLVAMLLALSTAAMAETRFAPAPAQSAMDSTEANTDGPREAYPDSRFGYQPARQTDQGEYMAPVASGNMNNPYMRASNRSPAGLVMDSDEAPGENRMPSNDEQPYQTQSQAPSSHPRMVQEDLPIQRASDVAAQASRRGIQEVAVIADDLGFFPKTIFVTRDIPVRMYVTGASQNTLCIMMDSFGVRKQVRSKRVEEITFTPSMPGKYRYYCPVNGMEGSLVVKELSDEFLSRPSAPPSAGISSSGERALPPGVVRIPASTN